MKIGIVGTGMIAQKAVPILKDCGWELSALCGTVRSSEIVNYLCNTYQIEDMYFDYDAFLGNTTANTIYIAVPNHLHFEFSSKALRARKNVIIEKPMTSNIQEAEQLAALAEERNLYLFEAVSTIYLPNFEKIKTLLSRIGDIKIVTCNFSQYSRRYDAFRSGNILPVFDPQQSGGALMDLNIYNLHYLIGLFGKPQNACYYANIAQGIDTSGMVLLNYGGFHAVSIASKDCNAPSYCTIQGTSGYIHQHTAANRCGPILLHLNDGSVEEYDDSPASRLESEFRFFAKEISSGSRKQCYETLRHSLLVSEIQTDVRRNAGIYFSADHL